MLFGGTELLLLISVFLVLLGGPIVLYFVIKLAIKHSKDKYLLNVTSSIKYESSQPNLLRRN